MDRSRFECRNAKMKYLSLIANLSEGSLRDAESLFDQIICYAEHPITLAKVSATLGLMPRTALSSPWTKRSKNKTSLLPLNSQARSSLQAKISPTFLDHLIEHYRSLLKCKLAAPVSFPTAKLKEQYSASSLLYTEEQCLYILDFLIQWQQQIGKTPFKRVGLEMILLHLIRSKHRIALPQLVRRLIELEQKLHVNNPPSAPIEPVIISSSEKISENPSLEDTLIKKIQEKIESIPPVVEEAAPEKQTQSSSLLLSKSQWETIANSNNKEQKNTNPSPVPEAKQAPLPAEPPPASQSRYETLMRFAAVELEGIIKKEQTHG